MSGAATRIMKARDTSAVTESITGLAPAQLAFFPAFAGPLRAQPTMPGVSSGGKVH
jgi:hypothetical protein